MSPAPHCLLINPWIHDFAAYDLWAQPIGLLRLGSWLQANECQVSYINCLKTPKRKPYGQGSFKKAKIERPPQLINIPRHYYRFGISEKEFGDRLKSLPTVDIVLVTSLMTYWYPGVFQAIQLVRAFLPSTPIVLGGIYATLCFEHASTLSGADFVLTGKGETTLPQVFESELNYRMHHIPDQNIMDSYSSPLMGQDADQFPSYGCLLTSEGCPYNCSYCAATVLGGRRLIQHSVDRVLADIHRYYHEQAVSDFAFYDDALLLNKERHIKPILKGVIRRYGEDCLRFHCPNGLHISEIDEELADLMLRAGFRTFRLSLETSAPTCQERIGIKATLEQLAAVVSRLQPSRKSQQAVDISVYILAGLPQQTSEEVVETIEKLHGLGLLPRIAEYSPVPHTDFFVETQQQSTVDLQNEPLWHNNTLMPYRTPAFSAAELQKLKDLSRAVPIARGCGR